MSFTPTNELEQVLLQATQDPTARPRFYQLLLESQLFVLVPPNNDGHGERTLTQAEDVSIVSWKQGEQDIIPMFTSLPWLQEAIQGNGHNQGYLAMRGRDLFGVLGGGSHPGGIESQLFGRQGIFCRGDA